MLFLQAYGCPRLRATRTGTGRQERIACPVVRRRAVAGRRGRAGATTVRGRIDSGAPLAGARGGITVGDVDNDGWPDLFVTGDGGRASLLLDEAGYAVTWDGTDEIGRLAATGVYLVRLHAGGVDRTRKLTLIR